MVSATPSAPVSRRSTPPQVTSGPQLECVACRRLGPVGQVLQCTNCKVQIHAGACGAVVKLSEIETWTCEICNNEKTEEASLVRNEPGPAISCCSPSHRIRFACCALTQTTVCRPAMILGLHTCEPANLRKAKPGLMSYAPCSPQRSPSRTMQGCDWWKALQPYHSSGGCASVSFAPSDYLNPDP
jgi:hypothetical protein